MLEVIGYGDEQSKKDLKAAIKDYVEKIGDEAEPIITTFLKEENAQNADLTKLYRRAIRENKPIQSFLKYDYEYKKDVLY